MVQLGSSNSCFRSVKYESLRLARSSLALFLGSPALFDGSARAFLGYGLDVSLNVSLGEGQLQNLRNSLITYTFRTEAIKSVSGLKWK